MLSERNLDGVRIWAPAKVNLHLEVLAKRPDGYHDIETLMVAVSLYDTLEFKEDDAPEVRLACDYPGLSTGPENLIVRAANLLRERVAGPRGVNIRLVKRIPVAAGLAGGSTDAAATLAGLNRLWRLGLTATELAGLGADLGSDVAFFFSTPAAWCTGRGERVEVQPLGRPLWLVLLFPLFGLATADVYRGVQVPEQPIDGTAIRQAVVSGDEEEIGRRLHNRLQAPAQKLRPELADYLARLNALRPAGLLMSGSGSTLFALCRNHGEAMRVAHGLAGLTDNVFVRCSEGRPVEGATPGRRVGLGLTLVRSCF